MEPFFVRGNTTKSFLPDSSAPPITGWSFLAVIVALKAIREPGQMVHITSDSKYVVDAVSKGWVFGLGEEEFRKKTESGPWKRFLKVYRRHQVQFHWIKGHSGHAENERCDQLAVWPHKVRIFLQTQGINSCSEALSAHPTQRRAKSCGVPFGLW